MVSFLYDAAGRSEDAYHLRWGHVELKEGGAIARLPPGKTAALRTVVLTPLTVELLNMLDPRAAGKKDEPVFGFNRAGSMRVWLKRQVGRVRLPAESSIDPSKWQCHNLRTSRITQLCKEGMRPDQIRLVSGHADLRNLQCYIKTDEAELHAELIAQNRAKEAARRDAEAKPGAAPQRRRDVKAADK